MIQVIERAFAVLELLAGRPGRSVPLGEIAAELGLNKATCAHILKTLADLHAAEQSAPRQGYRLGPALYALARSGGGYRADLVAAAEPLLRTLAAETRETVLLAVLRGHRRFTLCQINGTHDVQVRSDPMIEAGTYSTATGRLLLAFAGQAEREAFIAAAGLPGPQWPEVTSRRRLDAALEAIRRDGRLVHHTPSHVVGLAWPVAQQGRVVAALGLFLPEFRFTGPHRTSILAAMERTATAVTGRLSEPVARAAVISRND